jgi:drug/metabolite transporter (DMT)-like permease
MDGTVTLAALCSALLHATWSAMAYRFRDQAVGFAMMGWVSVVFGLTLIAVATPPARASWPWIVASILVHVVYTVALVHANGLARFSQVYPISRGLAPVLVASMIPLGIGDRLTPRQLVAVGVIVAGLLIFASVKADAASLRSDAVRVAVVVSALIGTYTIIDGLGVRTSGSALGYAGWLSIGQGLLTVAVLQSRRTLRQRLFEQRGLWKWAVVGGSMASAGYATMIWAQQHGTLAVVAALRETSIVFATIIGVLVFREGAGARRLVAAILVVAGIAMLQLS